MKQFKYKIFYLPPPLSSIDTLTDWQSDELPLFEHTTDINEVLSQPYRVAAVPAMFNVPRYFTYNETLANIDWSKFDLVIVSEIESIPFKEIKTRCLEPAGIRNYLLALGAFQYDLSSTNIIYRPWWMFYHLALNASKKFDHEEVYNKPFLFDALLGQARPHRHYVMSRFQKNQNLLDNSIVTYRKFFGGSTWEHCERPELTREIKKVLDGDPALYPYESPNLKSEWEVVSPYGMNSTISGITPWEIYKQTYYSVVCETNWYNNSFKRGKFPPIDQQVDTPGPFFLTEKMAKVLLGRRLFVMFGPMHILKFFREQGFKTFDNVIDESYDECSNIPERFRRAFDQVEYLSTLDPKEVLQATEEVRKYNFEHLYNYRNTKKNQMHHMILDSIPNEHLYNNLEISLPELGLDELIRSQWG